MFRNLFNRLVGKPSPPTSYDAEKEEAWYNDKTAFLEQHLGAEHEMVSHTLIPYRVGGGLDLYYYPRGISGTAVATKELVDADGTGPSNSVYDFYELVMFTRQPLDLDEANNDKSAFGAIHATINATLNLIARYGEQVQLNPHDTCEFPEETEQVGGSCVIVDAYTPVDQLGPQGLGLLLIMQVHRSEFEFAKEHGVAQLVSLLKTRGCYPYSDLDRPTVV